MSTPGHPWISIGEIADLIVDEEAEMRKALGEG